MTTSSADFYGPLQRSAQELGSRLETYRISRNLKQADLAKLAGLSRSTLARVESGKGGTLDSLLRILAALDLDDRLSALIPDAANSPLEAGRRRADKPRQRVRDRADDPDPPNDEPWSWDDDTP